MARLTEEQARATREAPALEDLTPEELEEVYRFQRELNEHAYYQRLGPGEYARYLRDLRLLARPPARPPRRCAPAARARRTRPASRGADAAGSDDGGGGEPGAGGRAPGVEVAWARRRDAARYRRLLALLLGEAQG